MRRLFLCMYFCLFTLLIHADGLDSLRQSIKQAKGVEKVRLMLDLAEKERLTNGNRNLPLLLQAIEVSTQNNLPEEEIDARIAFVRVGHTKLSQKVKLTQLLEAKKKAVEIGSLVHEAHVLNKIGGVYFEHSEYGKAIEFYRESLNEYEKLADTIKVASLYNNIGFSFFKQGKFSKAMTYYDASLAMLKTKKDKNIESIVLSNLAQLYYSNGNLDLSIYFFNKADSIVQNEFVRIENQLIAARIQLKRRSVKESLELTLNALESSKKLQLESLQISSLINLADLYRSFGRFEKAIDACEEALSLVKENQLVHERANVYKTLGNIYLQLANLEEAKAFYERSLAVYEELGDRTGVSACLNNLGIVYTKTDKHVKALNALRRSLRIKEEMGNRIGIANTLYNISLAYKGLQLYEQANVFVDSSLIIAVDIGFKDLQTELFIHKADLALIKRNIEEAEYYYVNALHSAEKQSSMEHKLNVLRKLAELSAKQENNRAAYLYMFRYNELRDSALSEATVKSMAEFKAKFELNQVEEELAKKNIQLAVNEEKLETNQRFIWTLIGGAVLLAFSLVIFLLQIKTIRRKNKKIAQINSELDSKVKERTEELRLTKFAVENAAVPMLWTNNQYGILYANESASNLLKVSVKELLKMKMSFFDPIVKSKEGEMFNRLRHEKSLIYEAYYNLANGNAKDVECLVSYLSFDEKEYAFVFLVDIEERKRNEHALRAAKQKAEESDQLKTAFLANMSHEIRTPMNAILGFSELLLEEELDKKEQNELLGMVKKSGDELVNLIDDIIDISMIESEQLNLTFKETDLPSLVKDRYKVYKELLHKKAKSHLGFELLMPEIPKFNLILSDPFRLTQILNNLLSNAIKFTDEGKIRFGYREQMGEVLFFVEDTGIGINNKILPFIFDRFRKEESTNNKLYRGAGLGLAISKNLVELMEGQIWVESEEGKGSTFYFSLPVSEVESSNDMVELNSSGATELNWSDKKLLIVEDTGSNYQLLKSYLRSTEVQIIWAKDAMHANELISENNYDLILMDVQLPDGSGLDIVRSLREAQNNTPVIAQTAYAFNGERERCLESGCDEYLSKPIKRLDLIEKLSRFFEH